MEFSILGLSWANFVMLSGCCSPHLIMSEVTRTLKKPSRNSVGMCHNAITILVEHLKTTFDLPTFRNSLPCHTRFGSLLTKKFNGYLQQSKISWLFASGEYIRSITVKDIPSYVTVVRSKLFVSCGDGVLIYRNRAM